MLLFLHPVFLLSNENAMLIICIQHLAVGVFFPMQERRSRRPLQTLQAVVNLSDMNDDRQWPIQETYHRDDSRKRNN